MICPFTFLRSSRFGPLFRQVRRHAFSGGDLVGTGPGRAVARGLAFAAVFSGRLFPLARTEKGELVAKGQGAAVL